MLVVISVKLEFRLLINSDIFFKHPALWQHTFDLMNLDKSVLVSNVLFNLYIIVM